MMKDEELKSAGAANTHYAEEIAHLGNGDIPSETLTHELDTIRGIFAATPEYATDAINQRAEVLGIPEIFKDWKRDNDNLVGLARSWTGWLSDTESGASDEQLLSILQWDKHRIDELSAAHAPEITALFANYKAKLSEAVDGGILDQSILSPFDYQVTFGGAFDYRLAGPSAAYALQEASTIVLGEDYVTEDTLGHEYNHLVGDFVHPLLAEASAELIAQTALGNEITAYTPYDERVDCLRTMLEVSHIGIRELSGLFAGKDYLENQRRLTAYMDERTGIDLVTIVTDYYDTSIQEGFSAEFASRFSKKLVHNIANILTAVREGTFDEIYSTAQALGKEWAEITEHIRERKAKIIALAPGPH